MPVVALEGLSLCGSILVPFSLPRVFGGRAGFDLKISRLWSGFTGIYPLCRGEAGDGLGLKPSVDQGLSTARGHDCYTGGGV